MMGVVHEWGMKNVECLLDTLSFIQAYYKFPEIILLSPEGLSHEWLRDLNHYAFHSEQSSTGLVKS